MRNFNPEGGASLLPEEPRLLSNEATMTEEERTQRANSLLSAIEWYTHTSTFSEKWKTDLYFIKEMLSELINKQP